MSAVASAYRAEPFSYAEAQALAAELGLSDPVAIALVRRGYRTPEAARAFLAAEEEHPPNAFDSMPAVVESVLGAIAEGRRITVHGDFDVDGVCATAVLVGTLRELGADCDWLIPDRLADGYGLSEENVRKLASRGTRLLITVDCGITATAEVELATELGMKVVVTDHHQPGDSLPDCPILHPSLDGYPFSDLCGTAVARKLACALRGAVGGGPPGATSRGVPGEPPPTAPHHGDLDLVALATVADLVPLVGENRTLVRRGLEEVRRTRRPGMRALLAAAKCEPSQLDEGDLAFRLAPRINAAGRLYRADAGVELFLTEDAARAEEIANELGRANSERRATEREVMNEAEAALRALPEDLRDARGLVLAGKGWHPGVIGIVASRLVEKHHRPVVVISLDGDGGGRGSGRSIPGFDLLAALERCSSHLAKFGGHRAAAGLELEEASLNAFRDAFAAHANSVLGPEDLVRTERIDAIVGGASLGLDLAEELRRLAPFGMGNPGVRLLVPSAQVRDVRQMGEGKHARFSLHSGAHRALGVAFGRPSLGVGEDELVDAAVRLEANRWNGAVEPRLVLRELYPRDAGEPAGEATAWWKRFETELHRDPAERPVADAAGGGGADRTTLTSANAPAAVAHELAASRESVVALCADAERRVSLAREGLRLADWAELERSPSLAADFTHVVLVDPPPDRLLEALSARAGEAGGYLHRVWGEAEWRFALAALDEQLARREVLVATFRDLREAGAVGGEELRAALRGSGRHPRGAEAAARCFRVLDELGLLSGAPDGGGGEVRVVSSDGTELERSSAFRAYGARHQEARQYLEAHRHP
ncbi:MAG TPA: single-stranded-DNA-specific exonuclease RecJ [Solirubrobacterales bacterium]|nr:single-stranded-DNA-specific exonuclease RecJ [Solirubrobacterales bacterium]